MNPDDGGTTRFAGPGRRLGAGIINVAIWIAFIGATAAYVSLVAASLIVGVAGTVGYVVMDALLGGSPGKLMLGMRITLDDATTTPPGWRPAIVRSLPSLVGWVPFVGGMLNMILWVTNIVLIATDPDRRSVHDRVGKTRVVLVGR